MVHIAEQEKQEYVVTYDKILMAKILWERKGISLGNDEYLLGEGNDNLVFLEKCLIKGLKGSRIEDEKKSDEDKDNKVEEYDYICSFYWPLIQEVYQEDNHIDELEELLESHNSYMDDWGYFDGVIEYQKNGRINIKSSFYYGIAYGLLEQFLDLEESILMLKTTRRDEYATK